MLILGLETSCDETGVALYDTRRGLLAHALFSQIEVHVEYGGVVPELASRDHVRKALPLIQEVMAEAGCEALDIDGYQSDRSFSFITKTPPAAVLLKKAARVAKGSGVPNRDRVGQVTVSPSCRTVVSLCCD